MNDTTTPRPNVATGAFMGFFVMVMGLLLTALQTNPSTLEGWLVALQPVVAFVIAYFAPAFQKAWAALIGAGLIPFVLMIHAFVTAEVPFDGVFFVTCVVALVQAGVTGMVANTKADPYRVRHND